MNLEEILQLQQKKLLEYPLERRHKLDRLFVAFSIVAEGTYVYLCDMKYDISRWSKAAVDHFGLPGDYMYDAGDIWENFIHEEDREIYHAGINDIFSGKNNGHDMQYRAQKRGGGYDVCTCRGAVLLDENDKPNYFAGVIRNHGYHNQMDSLTGLRNQYGFFDDLQSNLNRCQEMSVLITGISKFSEINEVYGYDFGNRVLQCFGRFLCEVVGNSGSVYRIDGTKFAVISNTAKIEFIRERYRAFRRHFRSDFQVDGRNILLELNAGYVFVNHFDVDTKTIFACLNFAYTESKTRRQGGLVEFYNDLNESNRSRIERLNAIRNSIMHGYQGFYLLYQPVVDALSENLIGAEALLRWRNDKFNVVPPDQFIPLLESDPLFPELGEWILREALSAAKQILSHFPDFVMNVNLSYTQLERSDFCDVVIRAIREADYPAEHLCLEVTERCRLLDMDLLKNVLASLKSHGIRIALDDFGTGFSSVGLVKDLPFDIIKIDRSFVQQIENDDMERELMRHFSGLASSFGAKVCVEGIETEGMRDILQKYHVQSFQGYYYAKPLTLEDFLNWKPQDKK
ncbi:MAG: GGDEF and EAL domain-containing protein [Eubacterium sp.]|nr:GGDEF and EAL domain-containing protein [Eubacterium sp.]